MNRNMSCRTGSKKELNWICEVWLNLFYWIRDLKSWLIVESRIESWACFFCNANPELNRTVELLSKWIQVSWIHYHSRESRWMRIQKSVNPYMSDVLCQKTSLIISPQVWSILVGSHPHNHTTPSYRNRSPAAEKFCGYDQKGLEAWTR